MEEGGSNPQDPQDRQTQIGMDNLLPPRRQCHPDSPPFRDFKEDFLQVVRQIRRGQSLHTPSSEGRIESPEKSATKRDHPNRMGKNREAPERENSLWEDETGEIVF